MYGVNKCEFTTRIGLIGSYVESRIQYQADAQSSNMILELKY